MKDFNKPPETVCKILCVCLFFWRKAPELRSDSQSTLSKDPTLEKKEKEKTTTVFVNSCFHTTYIFLFPHFYAFCSVRLDGVVEKVYIGFGSPTVSDLN